MKHGNPPRTDPALYNWGASLYDLITTQYYWWNSVCRLARHLSTRRKALRILDLGCGAGISTFALGKYFEQGEIVGIDIASKMIARARHHHRTGFAGVQNVHFLEADATALPFENQSFDVAIGHSFLYLVPQKLQVLQEVNRVLKPGGQIVLMEPYARGSLFRTLLRRLDYLGKLWRQPGPTLRFIASIIAWRLFSLFKGQLSPQFIRGIFTEAGFHKIATVPTLDHLGVFCIGFV